MNRVTSWLQFRVGEQFHALEAAPVRQILRSPNLLSLPASQRLPCCAGMLAWQGRPLLVLDLGACLQRRPSLSAGDARFLVWTQAQHAGVLAVDEVGGLLRLCATTLTRHWAPVQPGLPPPWNAIRGLLRADTPSVAGPAEMESADPIAVFDVAALWQACWDRAGDPR